jgi:hypothetical protein
MTIQTEKTRKGAVVWGLAAIFCLMVWIPLAATAQSDDKLKSDPTYSIRNYKHPNKADAARAWESEIVLGRASRDRRRVNMGDYKRTATTEPGRSVLVIGTDRKRNRNPEMVSGYNYKNPRPNRFVANRDKRKPAKPIEIVPAEETPTGNDE